MKSFFHVSAYFLDFCCLFFFILASRTFCRSFRSCRVCIYFACVSRTAPWSSWSVRLVLPSCLACNLPVRWREFHLGRAKDLGWSEDVHVRKILSTCKSPKHESPSIKLKTIRQQLMKNCNAFASFFHALCIWKCMSSQKRRGAQFPHSAVSDMNEPEKNSSPLPVMNYALFPNFLQISCHPWLESLIMKCPGTSLTSEYQQSDRRVEGQKREVLGDVLFWQRMFGRGLSRFLLHYIILTSFLARCSLLT